MKYTKYVFVIIIIILSVNETGFALGKIVDYFLENPNAWNDTKRITRSTPIRIVVEDGLIGLGFKLTEITKGDEVALIFLETGKVVKMNHEGLCDTRGKLIKGNNRIVSVITKNYGNRREFHYKFMLQKNMNTASVTIYNDGDAVLESEYDGGVSVVDMSDLSGIRLCEIEIR